MFEIIFNIDMLLAVFSGLICALLREKDGSNELKKHVSSSARGIVLSITSGAVITSAWLVIPFVLSSMLLAAIEMDHGPAVTGAKPDKSKRNGLAKWLGIVWVADRVYKLTGGNTYAYGAAWMGMRYVTPALPLFVLSAWFGASITNIFLMGALSGFAYLVQGALDKGNLRTAERITGFFVGYLTKV